MNRGDAEQSSSLSGTPSETSLNCLPPSETALNCLPASHQPDDDPISHAICSIMKNGSSGCGLNRNKDLYEPRPLAADQFRHGPPLGFYMDLANSKIDSFRDIEDDAVLFDRLAEVCNLGSTSATKRAAPTKAMLYSFSLKEPIHKRQKQTDLDGKDETAPRFRPYQQKHWDEQFECLLAFREDRGHCCVPHDNAKYTMLSRWVRRQRYQYKLKQEGKKSTMTDSRLQKLNAIAFVWDSHAATWSERLFELVDYLRENGDCNVPATYQLNTPLSTWVKCQRRQYRLFQKGSPSNMTLDRIKALDRLGFEWDRSNGKRNRKPPYPRVDFSPR